MRRATFPIFATARKNMGQLNTRGTAGTPLGWTAFAGNDQIALRSIYKAHFPAVRRYVLARTAAR